jgi:hypothetical protein
LFAASEARAAGWGGLAAVSNITGLARSTIERGLKDLDAPGGMAYTPPPPRSAALYSSVKMMIETISMAVKRPFWPASAGGDNRWWSASLARLKRGGPDLAKK